MNIARLFSVVTLFAWVAFFLVLAFVVLQASRKTPVKRARVHWLLIAGVDCDCSQHCQCRIGVH